MVVRLTKKLAQVVNGLDLSQCGEGDVIDVPTPDARMLLAEGWAEELSPAIAPQLTIVWRPDNRAIAAERPARRSNAEGNHNELIGRLGMKRSATRIDPDPDTPA